MFNIQNHIGSNTIRLSANGSLIDKEEFYPFGDSSLRTFYKKRYRYVGKEKDAESGLYYYGGRYYSAWTCRFITVDPLASKYQFYSPYIYAGNKPINKIDIDGMQEEGAKEGQQGENPPPIDSSLEGAPENANLTTENIITHNVQEGETMTSLAERYNSTIDAIRQANPQTQKRRLDDQINAGENIKIPTTMDKYLPTISKEGISGDQKMDFNYKDADFWDINPKFTESEQKMLKDFGITQGVNKLAKEVLKKTPFGRILELFSYEHEDKSIKIGPSAPGEDIIEFNNIMLEIQIKGRLRTLGEGASYRTPRKNENDKIDAILMYENVQGKIKRYELPIKNYRKMDTNL